MIGAFSASARGVGPDPAGMPDEKRVAQQLAQPGQGVAHRGLGQAESFAGTADVPFPHDGLKHDKQVEVDSTEINFMHVR